MSEVSMVGTFIILMVVIKIFFSCGNDSDSDAAKKANIENGVSVESPVHYEGENYQVVEAEFESLGFKNIKLIDLDDAGLFKKENEVKDISINGDKYFDSSDVYDPETATVIISYH